MTDGDDDIGPTGDLGRDAEIGGSHQQGAAESAEGATTHRPEGKGRDPEAPAWVPGEGDDSVDPERAGGQSLQENVADE